MVDWNKVCLLMNRIESIGVGDTPLAKRIREFLSWIKLPPLGVLINYSDRYEEWGVRLERIGTYVFNVRIDYRSTPVLTIFYNNDYQYSVDTCVADLLLLSQVIEKINHVSFELMAIDKVDREIERLQRLLDTYYETPYYGAMVDLIMDYMSESRWVD